MRSPHHSRSAGVAVVAAALMALAAGLRLPGTPSNLPLQIGLLLLGAVGVIFGGLWTKWRDDEARGLDALRRGDGVVERWQVPPAAWRDFVALNQTFNINEMTIRAPGPEGVEVIVGQRGIAAGGQVVMLNQPGGWAVENVFLHPGPPPYLAFRLRMGTRVASNLMIPASAESAARVVAAFSP